MKKKSYKNLALLILLSVVTFQGCEELNVVPTDKPYNPKTGMSTIDYFRTLTWDGNKEYVLLADLIERSGVNLTGNTLFAPADTNWIAWMQSKGYATVSDVPADTIKKVLLNHMVAGLKTRLDLDKPDKNPQTQKGTDVPSMVTSMLGHKLYVNVSNFGNTGRGLQMTVGTSSADKLILTGDIENTDAIVDLYGFVDSSPSDKGLLLP